MHTQVAPRPAQAGAMHDQHLRLTLGLIGVIWLLGLVGHFTPLAEWPALVVYVLGALALTTGYCARHAAWQAVGITRRNLRRALLWGASLGLALAVVDLTNTYLYYRNGGAPMAQMEQILVGMRLLYLFPLLVLAEEFLWRGMLFSALRARGWNGHVVVTATTLAYMLNHYAVAPVGMWERGLMALMGLPIGLAAGYLVLRTRNVWAGVAIHGLTMLSMILDVFVLPRLV